MKIIRGYGAPTTETIGGINDFYVDLDTNNAYRCTSIRTIGEEWDFATCYAGTLDNTEYTWNACGKANWEQNDPTQLDYIEGRTHYVKDDGTVVPLDRMFLPVNIQTTDRLMLVSPSGSYYEITVDDEGKLTATKNTSYLKHPPKTAEE